MDDQKQIVTYTKEGAKFTIKIDRTACIGAQTCVSVAPNTFKMDDQNIAICIENGDWDALETVLAAAQACPVFAIIVEDENGEQLYPAKA